VFIGQVTIPSIPEYGGSQASVSWTIPTASARKVFVKVDPLNSIDELDETDNIASRSVTSANLPDLTVGSTDIGFDPSTPRIGEGMNISVTVRNQGESPASSFLVWVYAGEPDQGGLRIAEVTYNNLSGGGSGTFQIPWIVAQGVDRITVKVDPLNQVSELNKDNNQAFRFLNSVAPPVQGVDLVAVPNSLSFSPGLPQEGSPVIVAAMVQNNGTYGTTNIVVDFFDGDPSNAVNKIFSTTIPILDSGQKEPVSFQHVFAKGTHTITMVVDPQNLISEASETNNTISASLTVLEGTAEEALTIPRNLRGTSTKTSITLQWDAVTRFYFGGYLVYRDGVLLNTVPIQHETYSDIGLPSGTLFHYQVSSVPSYLPGTYGDESPKSVPLAISTTINNIDLKVDYKDVTISPEDAKAGQTVTISARIHNRGTDPVSTGADVRIYTKETLIATLHTPSLTGGGESLVQATWVVTDPNDFIYIEADPDNVLLEQDEFNNLAIVSIIRNVRFTEFNQVINDSYRAMGDLNNDGALDVLDASGSVLLVNDGQGNFTALRPEETGFRTGRDYSSAFGDIDNDGYLDVFTCSTTGDNRLYKNNGNLTFTEITQQAGLKGINTYTVNAVFGDLNNDGYLDLFVGAFGGEQYIYLNNGDGTFRRIPGFSEGYENVELGDLDGDGYLDVVVCNGGAVIYKNDGTGHFTRHQDLPGTSTWDVALGDMDNDGYLDIVTLDGRVFFNDGHGNFSLANSVALPRSGVYTISLADFDHNGYLDILYSDTGVLIRNDGNRNFTDITPLNKLNLPWYTVLLGDIDNDGDIDIVGGQYIYKNEMNDNNYLIISLRGKRSNYYGIGSKISVYEEGHLGERDHLKGFRQVQAGGQGYVSQDSSNAHFGVNSNYKYDVQVIFPASKIVVNRRSTSTGQKLILPEIGDVSIQSDDISFSQNSPLVGEKVVMTAQVHNPTTIDMENVTVGFYDGDPAAGGAELGRLTMAYVPAQGNKDFLVEASLTEGLHEIYVVIDPDNSILETDNTNNKASKTLTVVARIIEQDLSISASDITIDPVAPWDGAQATITAVVHCSGENDVQDVSVSFYDGDPSQGGLLIGPAKISIIPVNGSAQTQIQWDTLGKSGLHYIHVVVDPLNSIRETNENNNVGIISVNVVLPGKPDLAISSSDIALSNESPGEGETITLNATVHNLGLQTGNVDVALYDGDPSAGGQFLGRSSTMQIIPSGGSAVFSFEVNTVGLSGIHNLFVSVDPDNRIDEMLETNNVASISASVSQAGLSLAISTDKATYTASEDIQITVNLNNLLNANRSGALEVKILDLNGNVVSTVVNNQALTLGPNEKRTANYLWNTSQTLSDGYKVYCDFIEAGNVIARGETPITIAPVKEIGSSIYPDKISYLSNRPVTITSTIQSASPNYIFSSLVARIGLLNGQGATLFSDTKTIPLLSSGQRVELKTYWNTSNSPRGTYAVRLEVLEGVSLLGTSTATFEILGSSQTNEGTLGTITAQPNLLYQGKDEILSYSVTNRGNEDISDLKVKVLIVNPDTQEIKNTLESSVNLPLGTTSTGNFIVSTSGLPPRTYVAILQASSATITQAKTLASTFFMVIQAVTLPFSDNFDSYTVGTSPPSPWFELCEGQAVITSAESYSGQNSLMTGGGPGNSHCALVGLGETYPDRISYEVRAKVNAAGSSAYIGFFEEIGDVVPQFNTVYFNGADGKVYFYSADKNHGFLVPLLDSFAVGVWYKVRVEIDFSILTADVYIDDVLVGQGLPISPKEAVCEYNGTYSFQLNKIGILHYLGEAFYFDDFSIFERRNHPPIADAGPNVAILGNTQYSAVIQGMASDPDNDPLSYRWLEGANELISWRPVGPNGECYLNLGSVPAFTLGEHILSLEVNDGKDISGDDMILTVNNSAPHPTPAGSGVCEINTQFPLKGQISDYDGDIVAYGWSEGNHLLFGGSIQTFYGGTPVDLPEYPYQCSVLGDHTISLSANDGVNQTVEASIHISVTDTSAPILAPVPDKNILWPPNHKMVTVSIQVNARDNSGGPVSLSAVVFSNEPQNGLGDGDMSPDWTEPVIDQVNGVITLQLRAERSGSGHGRVYTIRITATDTAGNSSYGDVNIIVPHDQGKK
jgi:subtilase family serine protease